jgi:ABC-type lipoprotein export system ATPase subunit
MSSLAEPSALELRDVFCAATDGDDGAPLHGVSATFASQQMHLLTGAPGSGHARLLRVLGLLETPDRGDVLFHARSTRALSEEARAELRCRSIGCVFASPFLLPAFSAIENVAMPLFKIVDASPEEARERAELLLDFAGLCGRESARVATLSPVEQHAVALARALAHEPAVMLVENLDAVLTGDPLHAFAARLRQACARFQVTVIVTVSPAFFAAPPDRVLEISNGMVRHDSARLRPSSV